MWRHVVRILGLVIIGIGAYFWFKNPSSSLITISFGVVSLAVSYISLPLFAPSAETKPPLKKWEATLIVIADRGKLGRKIRLLPSEHSEYLNRDWHPETKIKRVGEIAVKRRRCYGVEFRYLEPTEYLVWTDGIVAMPVDLRPGEVKSVYLPQPPLGSVQ